MAHKKIDILEMSQLKNLIELILNSTFFHLFVRAFD